ncbi:hypothetical protein BB28_14645 [Mycobacteroides chelonae CCUG 47445]|nr:hypothetical protein BB28_14645 [Mycobacteroides chelonae CCUG 47445]
MRSGACRAGASRLPRHWHMRAGTHHALPDRIRGTHLAPARTTARQGQLRRRYRDVGRCRPGCVAAQQPCGLCLTSGC